MSDLTEASLGKIVRQMLAALLHLHSFRLVHRDVHPDIFLVGGALGDTVKLCDFGCATFLLEGRKLCKPAGTYAFMSPQMLKGEEYDEKTDLWSLGVTVYAFLFGAFPYDFNGVDISKIQIVTTCNPPKFEVAGEMKESRSSDASNFVRALLQSDVEHRPSASEALHLPYMTMVVTSCDNENGVALPSLRPMLHLAREAGAIASLSLSRTTALDELVSIVQFDKLGVRMPDSWKKHQRSMATESYGKTLFESPDWADSVQVAKAWGPALGKGWGKKLSKTFSSTLLK
jgi:serine/threonine protein kinase